MPSLESVLGAETFLGIINTVKNGTPSDIVDPGFYTVHEVAELGNTGTYTKVEGTRQTARAVRYGSPSKRREQDNVTEVPVTLIHTFEHIVHKPIVLRRLRMFDSPQQQARGTKEIDRQTKTFLQLFINLRRAGVHSALTQGVIWIDGEGNLLASASGAQITIDFEVPAANKNQLDGIISASWATAGTDILGQLNAINVKAVQTSGYELTTAYYGGSIPGYFAGNTALQKILKTDSGLAKGLKEHAEFNVGGLRWVPASKAFFVDNDGTARQWWDDDAVVFSPDPSDEWFQMIDGTFQVPTDLGAVTPDAIMAAGSFQDVEGMFSYARIMDDPATIKHLAGDTFLPVLAVPAAIYQAVVAGF